MDTMQRVPFSIVVVGNTDRKCHSYRKDPLAIVTNFRTRHGSETQTDWKDVQTTLITGLEEDASLQIFIAYVNWMLRTLAITYRWFDRVLATRSCPIVMVPTAALHF